jgi:hypothetical protein
VWSVPCSWVGNYLLGCDALPTPLPGSNVVSSPVMAGQTNKLVSGTSQRASLHCLPPEPLVLQLIAIFNSHKLPVCCKLLRQLEREGSTPPPQRTNSRLASRSSAVRTTITTDCAFLAYTLAVKDLAPILSLDLANTPLHLDLSSQRIPRPHLRRHRALLPKQTS